MMRRTLPFLGGGLVEYHEWHLHEPLLQNYEGWRILDNPKYETKLDAWIDIAGSVRHIDPIIDDPRLTHKQRVCRLYRWALKELQAYLVQKNAHKFNLGYKVVRNRFEKYRYVTDPAACDMMVRESQKYMRDFTCYHYMRYNNSSPWSTYTLANPMFHPDGALVYDHWTHPDVMWYDDAKIHRWTAHNPMYAGAGEKSDRFGDWDLSEFYRKPVWFLVLLHLTYVFLYYGSFFYSDGPEGSPEFFATTAYNDTAAIRAEERGSRMPGASSAVGYDWSRIRGTTVADETVPSFVKYPK